ncbi:peroxiredoxin [Streptomyces sp. N2-109]|uniref:thioredoxin-dependent peroxiredoxin n=1 Tax=Streptomyces gossypii TaxID=2883101 RepID=A0ABT2K158_9ACTN|nr:peroxiredoxin [Streptomyces gossypii]MCT2593900.1 peroxiredoxin [Streptomyces gossypii]
MAKTPETGLPAPGFTLSGIRLTGSGAGEGQSTVERADFTLAADPPPGRPLLLAFYPGDDTSVCTRQLCAYSSELEVFRSRETEVWAISPQDLESHEAFARKHDLRMPLLADPDRTVAKAYGITAPGIGLRRAVFLIGPDGTLRWKHVALLGASFQSVDALKERLDALQAG